MCVVLLAYQVHADYPLVIAANRDEFWARPTQKLGWWGDPQILAGKDLSAQGTWMGIDRSGRIALVTNVREGVRPDSKAKSRGHLVSGFLQGTLGAAEYAAQVQAAGSEYAPFNLIIGSRDGLFFASNRYPVQALGPGVWGVSNGALTPPWPKTRVGMEKMKTCLKAKTLHPELFWELLADRTPAADADLPDTGIGLKLERVLSPLFVHWPERNYGTRSSSVLLVHKEGQVEFTEKTHPPEGGGAVEQVTFSI